MIIAVDFDGTLCASKWPGLGSPNTKLIEYLKRQQEKGDKLILWTCRTGELLDNAVSWCSDNGLCFDAINENIPERVELYGGEDSRKISADFYIDDRALSLRFR